MKLVNIIIIIVVVTRKLSVKLCFWQAGNLSQ